MCRPSPVAVAVFVTSAEITASHVYETKSPALRVPEGFDGYFAAMIAAIAAAFLVHDGNWLSDTVTPLNGESPLFVTTIV